MVSASKVQNAQSHMGESLSREWADDPMAPRLWDSLQLLKTGWHSGLSSLEKLAEDGSALAMMRLGHIYLSGQYGIRENKEAGENWLKRSSDAGSIDGRYRLAKHLQINNHDKSAIELYESLSNLGYAPAMFVLGQAYYSGDLVVRNADTALSYFRRAYAAGHIHAGHWLSHILMKEGKTVGSRLRGVAIRLKMLVPFVRLMVTRPNSDRFRR
jgi:TPR repeat protein